MSQIKAHILSLLRQTFWHGFFFLIFVHPQRTMFPKSSLQLAPFYNVLSYVCTKEKSQFLFYTTCICKVRRYSCNLNIFFKFVSSLQTCSIKNKHFWHLCIYFTRLINQYYKLPLPYLLNGSNVYKVICVKYVCNIT